METSLMTDAEIREKLNRTFQDIFDDPHLQIRPDMTADDVEDWDSLSHISLIVAVEKTFGLRFTTAEVQALANVGDFAALIGSKLR
jgi:acyl carrier protein